MHGDDDNAMVTVSVRLIR